MWQCGQSPPAFPIFPSKLRVEVVNRCLKFRIGKSVFVFQKLPKARACEFKGIDPMLKRIKLSRPNLRCDRPRHRSRDTVDRTVIAEEISKHAESVRQQPTNSSAANL